MRGQSIDVLHQSVDTLAQLPRPKRAAHSGADDSAPQRILLEAMDGEGLVLDAAHARASAQHDDGQDYTLYAVKPVMAELLRLCGDGSEGASRVEESGEPFQPKHRPAVKPLQAKIG